MTPPVSSNDNQFIRKAKGYPGRDQLDQASMRLRRAVARLHREGQLDPETAAKLGPIVGAAARSWDELAREAEKAADGSKRNRDRLAKAQAALDRKLARTVRQGRVPESLRRRAEGSAGPHGGDAA